MRGYVTKILALTLSITSIPTFSYLMKQNQQLDKQTLEQLLNAQTQQINTSINTIKQNLTTEYTSVKTIMKKLTKKLQEIQAEIQKNKKERTLNNTVIKQKLQELATIKRQLATHTTSLENIVRNQTQMQQENQQTQQMVQTLQQDLQSYKKKVTKQLITILSTSGSLGASLFFCWNIPLFMWLVIPASVSGGTYMGCDAYFAYKQTQHTVTGRFLKWLLTFYIKQKFTSIKQKIKDAPSKIAHGVKNTVIGIKDFFKRLLRLQAEQPGRWQRFKNFFARNINNGSDWSSRQATRFYSFVCSFARR